MGVNSPDQGPQLNGTPDPRLQPTPDYANLGPSSDIAGYSPAPRQAESRTTASRAVQIAAALIGMAVALVANLATSHGSRWKLTDLTEKKEPAASRPVSAAESTGQQRQAELLLEQAVAHSPGAVEEISSSVDGWQGKVQWTPQIASLTTAALNSDDMRVRESGVEVEIAAYGLTKSSQSLDSVLKTANSSDDEQKIWALWALGLLANRGVEPERAVAELKIHLSDSEVESRQWAVEALAVAGSDDALETLLKAMHDDVSPVVRERAACGVAESGLFSNEQRIGAVPKLLEYSDDPSLDAATHGWTFHALSDITHQHLGNDAAAWRSWYKEHGRQ